MFTATATYAVIFEGSQYALVSGATAARMVAAGSLATFVLVR